MRDRVERTEIVVRSESTSPVEDAGTVFRWVKGLVGCYLAVSAATLVVIALLSGHRDDVNSAVWTRAVIVVLSALLTFRFVKGAERGARRAYLRLRLVSFVMLVAIVVIVSLPGGFPVWMKIEQGICGLLLLGVVVLVNGRRVRARFE